MSTKKELPVCSFFLKGLCLNESCPFPHVRVNPRASLCPAFLRGSCPAGSECKLKHTWICQAYSQNGSCPDGKNCKLKHHPRRFPNLPSPPPLPTPTTTSIITPTVVSDNTQTSIADLGSNTQSNPPLTKFSFIVPKIPIDRTK